MAASENPRVRLEHIRDEIIQLQEVLAGISAEDFIDSYVLRRTTEHALLIVSEAVRALPRDLTDRYPDTQWAAIRAIGNVLRHEYFAIDPRVLWHTATDHLLRLAPVVEAMLVEFRPRS